MQNYTLGIIGGGNMAEALVRGIVNNSPRVQASNVVVSDPVSDRRELMTAIGAEAVTDNLIPAACPCVVLAVKPQTMTDVLTGINAAVTDGTLVISIAAGITTAAIDRGLGGKGRIIRVMPNTPLLVGEGMSALCAGPRASEGDMRQAEEFFAFRGKTVRVEEDMMDAVTAVSGSGPAYFFYLIEAMIEAGVAEGLPESTALLLATQTCAGAAKLLAAGTQSPQALRAKVTSPHGTTEAAIKVLDGAKVKEKLVKAIAAAADRSRELGKKK
ncbi:MAG: pyrroline-5-carboxylate reductase [Planctomycetaceae bacterium]|nr:pyrroline-5-carboxylate reductase [Planctomycetaceae bacterium]